MEPFLKATGYDPVFLPMQEIMPTPLTEATFPKPHDISGILITSANALQDHINLRDYIDLPIYVVGEQSAHAAQSKGFTDIRCAHGRAQDLIDMVLMQHDHQDKPYLYLRAEHIRTEIKDLLPIREIVTYSAKNTDHIPDNILNILQKDKNILTAFYSKRSASNFLNLVANCNINQIISNITALCLSTEIAEIFKQSSCRHIKIAQSPNRKAMDALLQEMIDQC